MSGPAPPDDPAARGPLSRGAGRAVLAAASGGAAAFLWVAAACQMLAFLGALGAGAGDAERWARGGLLLTVLPFRAPVTATVLSPSGLGVPGGDERSVAISVVFVPMLLTIAFVWLAGRAGRRAADRRPGRGVWFTTVVAAGGAAVPVAGLAALAAAGARLAIPSVSVVIVGRPAAAAAWAFGVAAVASGVGAALRAAGASSTGRIVRGGVTAYGWAILLLAVGVVVVAALEPNVTRGYLRLVGDTGPLAPAVLGIHALAFPAQSAVLLAPASGPCAEVVAGSATIAVCPWRLDPGPFGAVAVPRPVPLSPWLWPLSGIPAIAALLGGRRAALGVAGSGALALGAGSGLVFGAAAFVGRWFASPRAEDGRDVFLLPFGVDVDAIPFALALAAWGLVGGAVGGWIEGRIGRERASTGAQPPSRTSV